MQWLKNGCFAHDMRRRIQSSFPVEMRSFPTKVELNMFRIVLCSIAFYRMLLAVFVLEGRFKDVALYYSGRQSQQSFLLFFYCYFLPLTHSLYVSARAGHLQENICLVTDPLFGLSLHILSLIINRYV
jgi:hypothetical protein